MSDPMPILERAFSPKYGSACIDLGYVCPWNPVALNCPSLVLGKYFGAQVAPPAENGRASSSVLASSTPFLEQTSTPKSGPTCVDRYAIWSLYILKIGGRQTDFGQEFGEQNAQCRFHYGAPMAPGVVTNPPSGERVSVPQAGLTAATTARSAIQNAIESMADYPLGWLLSATKPEQIAQPTEVPPAKILAKATTISAQSRTKTGASAPLNKPQHQPKNQYE